MKFNNTQRIAAQHAASAVLGYKKTPSLFYIEKTSPARVTTSIRSCLTVRNLIGYDSILTSQSSRSVTVLIPFRYNRRSCCSLNVNLISTAPLPSHLPSAPALPSQPPEWNSYVLFLPLRSFLNQKKRTSLRGILCNVVSKCTLLFGEFAYFLRNLRVSAL